MKKLLISFLAVTAFISCKQEENKEPFFNKGEVTIKGKINNYSAENDSIKKVSFFYSNQLDFDMQTEASAKIDSDGNFSTKFTVSNPQVIFFYYDNAGEVYVAPNQNLEFNFDAGIKNSVDFEKSFSFNGSLKKENEELNKFKIATTIDKSDYYKKFRSLKKPEEALKLIDSLHTKENDRTKDFLSKNNVSENIKNWIDLQGELRPISDLLSYGVFRFRPTDKDKKFKDNFPEEYIKRIESLPKFDEKSFVNREIYTFLPNYYNAYLGRVIMSDVKDWKKIDSVLYSDEKYSFKENPEFFKILLFDRLNNQLKNNDTVFYQKNKELITNTFKNTRYEQAIKDKYSYVKELIENPVLSEGTELLSFKTNDAQEILNQIIKNANGKVVYIDNWATWCGPCKREFKEATPKLKKKFKGDIEFIYFCHQSEEGGYKPTISKYKIAGKHYFMNKEQTESLAKLLNITGFPTYSIINKKGKILHSGFEFRPSIPKTTEILTKLIKE